MMIFLTWLGGCALLFALFYGWLRLLAWCLKLLGTNVLIHAGVQRHYGARGDR